MKYFGKWFLLFLLMGSALLQAQYPLRTISEIQFVNDPATSDVSPLLGDTVEVRGLVMNPINALVLGPRWGCFVVDPDNPSDPWNGFFVIQNDSNITGTDFGAIIPGDICRFTGVVGEFQGFTQLNLLTNPLVPVVLESLGSIPTPVELGTDDLSLPAAAEQWEGQFVRIPSAEVIDANASSNRAEITDMSALSTFMDDYSRFFRTGLDNGTYNWPVNGTEVSVSGFVRGIGTGYSVNPRDLNDISVLSGPPVIGEVTRMPILPGSLDDVTVSATITDDGSVASATLHYSVDNATWNTTAMVQAANIWSADIPRQPETSYLRYFVSASDNNALNAQFPSDTSMASGSIFRYWVRNGVMPISDVQNDGGYGNGDSPYTNLNVLVQGVIMSSPNQFAGYFIQDAAAPWSGIFIEGTQAQFNIGDQVEVIGQVEEDFGATEINVSSITLLLENAGAFPPVVEQTGNLTDTGPFAEAYESVLVRYENVTVTDTMPDGQNNFGEFIIDDGSGGIRVDDLSAQYRGSLDGGVRMGAIGDIQGIHYYTFSRFKLEPRDDNDVNLALVGIADDENLPGVFTLEQNYPNPFNPETLISFQLPQNSPVKLVVYNALGQLVTVLVDDNLSAGTFEVRWNGRNQHGHQVSSGVYLYRLEAGREVITRKMVLLR